MRPGAGVWLISREQQLSQAYLVIGTGGVYTSSGCFVTIVEGFNDNVLRTG